MKSIYLKIYCLTLLSCLSLAAKAQSQYKDYIEFEKHTFENEQGELPYRLLKPIQYDENQSYPLVLFFHGAGERGYDNVVPLTHIAPLFTKGVNRKYYPCFVLVPQCPPEQRWVEVDWSAEAHDIPQEPSTPMQLTLNLLDEIIENYHIDTNRLYVTGLSMGGFATWDIIARYPDTFAAAVPICGGGDVATTEEIKDIPLWAFHGKLDQVVLVSRSRDMILSIREAGGKPKYTEYPNEYHGSWKPAYQEPDLLKWMFAQKKQP